MAITLEWLIEDRVILSTLSERVTINELRMWRRDIQDMIAIGIPSVHLVCDSRQLEHQNFDFKVFQQMIPGILKLDNFGWYIPVVDKLPVKLKSGIHICPTIESALEFLQAYDASLEGILQQTL